MASLLVPFRVLRLECALRTRVRPVGATQLVTAATCAGLRHSAHYSAPAAMLRQPGAPSAAHLHTLEGCSAVPSLAQAGSDVALPTPAIRTLVTKVRDPERPKQPATAWIRYLQHCRREKPDIRHSEVMKVAVAEWKAMTEPQKAPFVKPYVAEKAEYDKAFALYKDSGKLDAWKRDPEKPLKPMTAFLRYSKEVRKANPSLKMTEQTKLAAQKWKAMSSNEKAPYEQQAAPELKAYKEAMEKYKASGKEAAWKEKVGLSNKEAAAKKAKEKEQKEKEKAKLAKEKMKARLAKQKEREKLAKQKEKEKLAKQKEKEKLAKQKENEKLAKQKEKERLAKQKEKEKLAKQKTKQTPEVIATAPAAPARPAAPAAPAA